MRDFFENEQITIVSIILIIIAANMYYVGYYLEIINMRMNLVPLYLYESKDIYYYIAKGAYNTILAICIISLVVKFFIDKIKNFLVSIINTLIFVIFIEILVIVISTKGVFIIADLVYEKYQSGYTNKVESFQLKDTNKEEDLEGYSLTYINKDTIVFTNNMKNKIKLYSKDIVKNLTLKSEDETYKSRLNGLIPYDIYIRNGKLEFKEIISQ